MPVEIEKSRSIAWSDMFLLGHGPMDDTHREFVEIVSELQSIADDRLDEAMERLRAHAESHFGQEDTWMRQTDFPPRDCHIEQHGAVLKSIIEVQALTAQGHYGICRALADELAAWFPAHADYLDAALAQWLCKRAHGGVPVVLRRRMGS